MKQTISFTQEVEVLSQVKVSTVIVKAVKVNNHDGSIESALSLLSEVMENNSKAEGDPVYGSIWKSSVESGLHFTSKTLDYWVKKDSNPEETTLMLIRNTYKYE